MELPDYINPEAFDGFLEMRKSKGKRYALSTPRALTLLLNKLEKAYREGYDVNAMLDEATLENWQSVYTSPKHLLVSTGQNTTQQRLHSKLANLADKSWAH